MSNVIAADTSTIIIESNYESVITIEDGVVKSSPSIEQESESVDRMGIKLTRYEMSLERSQRRLDKMHALEYQMALEVIDNVSPVLDVIQSKLGSLSGGKIELPEIYTTINNLPKYPLGGVSNLSRDTMNTLHTASEIIYNTTEVYNVTEYNGSDSAVSVNNKLETAAAALEAMTTAKDIFDLKDLFFDFDSVSGDKGSQSASTILGIIKDFAANGKNKLDQVTLGDMAASAKGYAQTVLMSNDKAANIVRTVKEYSGKAVDVLKANPTIADAAAAVKTYGGKVGGALAGVSGTTLLGAAGGITGGAIAIDGIAKLYKGFTTDDPQAAYYNKTRGGMQLGGAALGAGIGTMILPVVGTAIGAGIGGLAGFIGGKLATKDIDEMSESMEILTANNKRLMQQDLDEYFGKVSLSMKDIKTIAKDISGANMNLGVNDISSSVAAITESKQTVQQIEQQITYYKWKGTAGYGLDQEEIGSYVQLLFQDFSGTKDGLQKEQQMYEGVLETFEGVFGEYNMDAVGSFIEGTYKGKVQAVDKLGKQLENQLNDLDWENLDEDKLTEIVNNMQEGLSGIQGITGNYAAEALLSRVSLGNVTGDQIEEIEKEIEAIFGDERQILDNNYDAIYEVLKEMELYGDPTEQIVAKSTIDKIKKWYVEETLNIDMAENKSKSDLYANIYEEEFSKLEDVNVERAVQGTFSSMAEQMLMYNIDEYDKERVWGYDNIRQLMGLDTIDEKELANYQETYEIAAPVREELAVQIAGKRERGEEVEAELEERLKELNQLGALAGDMDATYAAIADQINSSEEWQNLLTTLLAGGVELPDHIRELINQDILDSVSEMELDVDIFESIAEMFANGKLDLSQAYNPGQIVASYNIDENKHTAADVVTRFTKEYEEEQAIKLEEEQAIKLKEAQERLSELEILIEPRLMVELEDIEIQELEKRMKEGEAFLDIMADILVNGNLEMDTAVMIQEMNVLEQTIKEICGKGQTVTKIVNVKTLVDSMNVPSLGGVTGGILEEFELRKSNIQQRANGGFVSGRQLSWVGEEGPEAIIPLVPGRRGRGIQLWQQAGEMLGVLKHAAGGIIGDVMRPSEFTPGMDNTIQSVANIYPVVMEEEEDRWGYDARPAAKTTDSSGENSEVVVTVNLNQKLEISGDENNEGTIMHVIKTNMKEMADELSGQMAVSLEEVFSNMPIRDV